MKYFVFDTETNGLPKKNKFFSAISLGYHILDSSLVLQKEGYHLLKRKDIPLNAWDKGAMEIHGITHHKSIKEGEKPLNALMSIRSEMMGCHKLVAHNMKFDLAAINATFDMFDLKPIKLPTICTMKVAGLVFPSESKGLKPTWERIYKRKFDDTFSHHNSLDDSRACAHLLYFFINKGHLS